MGASREAACAVGRVVVVDGRLVDAVVAVVADAVGVHIVDAAAIATLGIGDNEADGVAVAPTGVFGAGVVGAGQDAVHGAGQAEGVVAGSVDAGQVERGGGAGGDVDVDFAIGGIDGGGNARHGDAAQNQGAITRVDEGGATAVVGVGVGIVLGVVRVRAAGDVEGERGGEIVAVVAVELGLATARGIAVGSGEVPVDLQGVGAPCRQAGEEVDARCGLIPLLVAGIDQLGVVGEGHGTEASRSVTAGVDPVIHIAAAHIGASILVGLELAAVEGQRIGRRKRSEVTAAEGGSRIGIVPSSEELVSAAGVNDDVGLEDVPGRKSRGREQGASQQAQHDEWPHEKTIWLGTESKR